MYIFYLTLSPLQPALEDFGTKLEILHLPYFEGRGGRGLYSEETL